MARIRVVFRQRPNDAAMRRATRSTRALARRPDARDQLTGGAAHGTELLALQRRAGNAAVVQALGARGARPSVVQRQPKGAPPPPPQWVVDAQSELGAMYGKDPDMQHVVIKDYARLNATLQTAPFGAWTQSRTEIYVKDYSGEADPAKPKTAKWPLYMLRYVLHHEAEHIRQFTAGPPATWWAMLTFEQKAYSKDITWLAGSEAKRLIPDATLRQRFSAGARQNVKDIKGILAASAKKKTSADREAARHQGMIDKQLIPAGAAADPKQLYVQPP